MRKTILIIFIFGFAAMGFSQVNAPSESQKERIAQKMEERKHEYISNFLYTLDADEFQKEIIKQKLLTFFDEKTILIKTPFKRTIEFEEAVRNLEYSHFKDIENMVTEDTMKKIIEMSQGDFNEMDVVKEKRKKRKKN